MERLSHLSTVVRKDSPGIEIGPWCHPVAPKRDGFRTTVIDILDTERLRQLARERDPTNPAIPFIEDVDIVGDGSDLLHLVRGRGITGRFGWIVSSHNFEHLTDPVRFLCDCEELLEPGGALAMIIPDKRFSLDRFQPAATLAGMLRVWIGGPGGDDDPWNRFAQQCLKSHLVDPEGKRCLVWSADRNDAGRLVVDDPRPAFDRLRGELLPEAPPEGFRGHRWRFTPAVFELLILDLRALGIVSMKAETFPAGGVEFSAIVRTVPPGHPPDPDYLARRSALCRRVEDEAAVVTGAHAAVLQELAAARAEIAALRSEGGVVPE